MYFDKQLNHQSNLGAESRISELDSQPHSGFCQNDCQGIALGSIRRSPTSKQSQQLNDHSSKQALLDQ